MRYMTGRDWVTALAVLHDMEDDAASAAAAAALDSVDLLDVADRKIGSYSKGMRQRLKLAQAIVHDPQLLVLDEPLSGMNPLMRRRIIRLIRQWAIGGKSVIVSSHVLHEVEAMTATIVLMHNGRIVAEGMFITSAGSSTRILTVLRFVPPIRVRSPNGCSLTTMSPASDSKATR